MAAVHGGSPAGVTCRVAVAVIGGAMLLLTSSPAVAQREPAIEALERGRRSIALGIPDAQTGELALWRMRSNTLNRGLLLRVNAQAARAAAATSSSSSQGAAVALGPAFRRYLSRGAPVAPFVQTTVLVGADYHRRASSHPQITSSDSRWGLLGELGFGVGAEWFPHRAASLGGHTGARVQARYVDHAAAEHWQIGLATFSSAITLHIYF